MDRWMDTAQLDSMGGVQVAALAGLSSERTEALKADLDQCAAESLDVDVTRWLPPISQNARIFCIGLNYGDHAEETSMEKAEYPLVFLRTFESFVGHRGELSVPVVSSAFDFEGELVVVLKKGGRYLAREAVSECIGAFSVANEGSIRDFQLAKGGGQWTMGKNFHASGSIGPDLVSTDELAPLGKGLGIETRLNGESVQRSNTRNMLFDLPELVAYLSQAFLLRAGDVILTGTPAGVGIGRQPPLYMKAGDDTQVEIEGVGLLQNRVTAERPRLQNL